MDESCYLITARFSYNHGSSVITGYTNFYYRSTDFHLKDFLSGLAETLQVEKKTRVWDIIILNRIKVSQKEYVINTGSLK